MFLWLKIEKKNSGNEWKRSEFEKEMKKILRWAIVVDFLHDKIRRQESNKGWFSVVFH